MFGNGAMTGMTPIIIASAQPIIHRGQQQELFEFCGAAPGTAIRATYAARPGATTTRTVGTTVSGFV